MTPFNYKPGIKSLGVISAAVALAACSTLQSSSKPNQTTDAASPSFRRTS